MHSPLWASLFCCKKSSVVAANFLLPSLPTQHSTRWQLQAARSLSFAVSKRKRIVSCRSFTGLQHCSEPSKQKASARKKALTQSNKHFTARGNWLRTTVQAFERVPAYSAGEKRQRIILGKDVRIKDRVQERCPAWEETERHNWNVRKPPGRGLVIHANVKSTGNKGNWAERVLLKTPFTGLTDFLLLRSWQLALQEWFILSRANAFLNKSTGLYTALLTDVLYF